MHLSLTMTFDLSPCRDDGPQVVYGLPQPVSLQHQIQLVILLRLTRQAEASQLAQPLPEVLLHLQARHTRLPSQSLLRLGTGGHEVPLSPNEAVHLGLEYLELDDMMFLMCRLVFLC